MPIPDPPQENLAAISALFHKDELAYHTFYNAVGGDFVNIWHYMVTAAEAFTAEEQALRIEWDGEWIESIENFVHALWNAAAYLDTKALREATRQAIAEAFKTNRRTLKLHTGNPLQHRPLSPRKGAP